MNAEDKMAFRRNFAVGREIELQAEIDRLQKALISYGVHKWECAYPESRGERPCDCGWAEQRNDTQAQIVPTEPTDKENENEYASE